MNAAPNGPISIAGRERLVSDQRVRRRQRQPIHRAARRQAIALRAVAAAVLHRTRRANGGDDELAHDGDQLGDDLAGFRGAVLLGKGLGVDRRKT